MTTRWYWGRGSIEFRAPDYRPDLQTKKLSGYLNALSKGHAVVRNEEQEIIINPNECDIYIEGNRPEHKEWSAGSARPKDFRFEYSGNIGFLFHDGMPRTGLERLGFVEPELLKNGQK